MEDGPRERPFDKRHIPGYIRDQIHGLKRRVIGWSGARHIGGAVWTDHPTRGAGGIWLPNHGAIGLLAGCALMLCFTILLLDYLRRGSRTQTVFQSPARSQGSVRVTQHHPDGPSIDDSRGPVEIRKYQPDLGSSIRHRVKQKAHDKKTDLKSKISWKPVSASSSATTLVETGDKPEQDHEEHHDGLIELKQTNGTRNFHDPETGETLHLSPWKSTHDSSDEESEEEPFEKLEKGTIQRTLTEMSVGSAILGGGKAAENSLHEKAQAESKSQPQQMGDTLAGLVTTESSSVKEAFT